MCQARSSATGTYKEAVPTPNTMGTPPQAVWLIALVLGLQGLGELDGPLDT